MSTVAIPDVNVGPPLVVGVWRGRYLRFTGQQFVLLAAPARSGKGVGIVVPNLLSYPDSVVVLFGQEQAEAYRIASADLPAWGADLAPDHGTWPTA